MRTNIERIFWDIRIPEFKRIPGEALTPQLAQLIFDGGYHSLEDYLEDCTILDDDRRHFLTELEYAGIDPRDLIDFG